MSELEQVLGSGVGIRACVDQNRRAPPRGKRRGNGGPADVREPADLEQAGGEHRSGVPRRDDHVGTALGDRLAGEEERAVALLARRVGRLLVHPDDLRRLDDLEIGRERRDHLSRAEEDRRDTVAERLSRSGDDLVGRPVAAHRVDGDSDLHPYGAGLWSGSTSRPR